MGLRNLDSIMISHGTDKATVFTRTCARAKGYAPVYDQFFTPLRHRPVDLIEIGVGGGESIRSWLDYFPHAHVVGVDNVANTNDWNTPDSGVDYRYTFVAGDQSKLEFWESFKKEFGQFDILVDDGSHRNDGVIQTFLSMWSRIKPGGLYCIEDLACSYSPIFINPQWPPQMDLLKGKADDVHTGSDIEFIHFTKELAIIGKAK
jgi:Methyltransferase domain